jgi:uncharacterized membrane protein YgaE (UPF0421/DUF939 family)
LIPQAPLALISNYEKRGCRATALWRAKIISAADSAVTLMMKLPPLQPRHLEAVTFSAKAAVSALAGVLSYQFLHLPGSPWVAAVSAVVVTQPALHSSLKASSLRVAANLAGAFGGAALSLVIGQPLVAMTIGIMLTGLVCYALKQDDMLRPAFVAVILVTLAGETGQWRTSLNRVVGVMAGCLCAVAVGFLFDKFSERFKLQGRAASDKSGSHE